ncbi:MAG: MFS transporter [Acidobacteriota bacterium]|nr:MFS transporter [Acidobacteriota bacterium]
MSPKKSLPLPALAAILYFSQGFPFGIVNETVNLYLSFAHVPLGAIGLVGGVGVVWTLKFFWSPLIDAAGTYRAWIFGALAVMAVSIAAIGAAPAISTAFWGALIALAIASATQDIAIDALVIRLTPEKLLGTVNSARVASYRAAMIAAGGGVGVLADRIGWQRAFLVAAAVPLLILALIAATVPRESGVIATRENPLKTLMHWLRKPGAFAFLAIILLYRLGDNTLSPMIRRYWESRGYSAGEVGNVTTTLGMLCTIGGAIAGGAFVTRFGVYRGLLWLGIVQMLSNLTYAFVAMTNAGRMGMYGAAVTEAFCGGLGTAAFLSFLMYICDRENAATEYALLTALFGVARTFAFSISGYCANALGFTRYYSLTAALALPGLALLRLVRDRLSQPATAASIEP